MVSPTELPTLRNIILKETIFIAMGCVQSPAAFMERDFSASPKYRPLETTKWGGLWWEKKIGRIAHSFHKHSFGGMVWLKVPLIFLPHFSVTGTPKTTYSLSNLSNTSPYWEEEVLCLSGGASVQHAEGFRFGPQYHWIKQPGNGWCERPHPETLENCWKFK